MPVYLTCQRPIATGLQGVCHPHVCPSAWHLVLCDIIDATHSRSDVIPLPAQDMTYCTLAVAEVMSPFSQHKGYIYIRIIMTKKKKSRTELLIRHSQIARRWLLMTLRGTILFAHRVDLSEYLHCSDCYPVPFAPLT